MDGDSGHPLTVRYYPWFAGYDVGMNRNEALHQVIDALESTREHAGSLVNETGRRGSLMVRAARGESPPIPWTLLACAAAGGALLGAAAVLLARRPTTHPERSEDRDPTDDVMHADVSELQETR